MMLSDAMTNRFLDYVVLTKFCHQCTQMKNTMSEEDFQIWLHHHVEDGQCQSNFEGPPTEMEREAIKTMFSRSQNYNLIYLYLVGDGDSKSFLDI